MSGGNKTTVVIELKKIKWKGNNIVIVMIINLLKPSRYFT